MRQTLTHLVNSPRMRWCRWDSYEATPEAENGFTTKVAHPSHRFCFVKFDSGRAWFAQALCQTRVLFL